MNVLGAQIAGDGELPLIGRYAAGSLLLAVAAFLMAVFLKSSLPEQSSPPTPPARTTIGLFPLPTTTTSIPFLVIREPDWRLPLQSSFLVAEEQEETVEHHRATSHRHERQSQQFTFTAPRQQQTPDSSTTAAASSSYDSVRQVVTHLVRDWSELGAAIRTPLYDWCSSAITKHYNTGSSSFSSSGAAAGPILVPGAGLGRLAWQLAAVDGYLVEALESSTVMAAAAYAMYHYHDSKPRLTIHPYAADPFSNEVDSRQRYTSCRVPDINTTTTSDMIWSSGGRLSYTVATFDLEAIPRQHYGAVVTCFFLDTATTLVDYIGTIQAVLKNGGLWINVGPLQWHLNSKVPLVADELRVLLTNVYHFTVLHWSVDETVLNYRDASRSSGSTFSDGYRPLRFILRWD
jgi:N2227-like protein